MGSIRSVICHHTAGPISGNTPSLNVVTNGRPGLSGPLAQIFLARDGTVYLVAAGRAWHAGVVRSTSYQNSHAIGIEAENTGLSNDSPWPKHQMDAYAKLCKALANEFSIPVSRVVGHKEACSPAGRKVDPTFNMNDFRGKVSGAKGGVSSDLGGSSGGRYGSPKAKHKVGSRVMGLYDGGTDINWLQRRLPKVGFPAGDVDGLFGSDTEAAVTAFQKKVGLDVDGLVGPDTLAALKAARVVGKAPKKKKPRKSQKAPKFPLKKGHWYGPESSNKKNHSGYWAGDRAGIRKFQKQLKKRGWSIGVDGLYGPETTKIVRQFQAEKGLRVDGAVGIKTWKAIWEEPVT